MGPVEAPLNRNRRTMEAFEAFEATSRMPNRAVKSRRLTKKKYKKWISEHRNDKGLGQWLCFCLEMTTNRSRRGRLKRPIVSIMEATKKWCPLLAIEEETKA